MRNAAPPPHPLAAMLVASPFVLFLFPTVAAVLARSEVPALFGRYSWSAAGFLLLTVAAYAHFIFAWRRHNWTQLELGAVAIMLLTYIAAASNGVRGAPGMMPVLAVTRVLAVAALAVVALYAARQKRAATSAVSLILAALLIVPNLVDFADSLVPEKDELNVWGKYRISYDLSQVTDRDIVIVGDSYVWGAGVPIDKRFGDLLERKLVGSGKVYSLGMVGANLRSYALSIQHVPAERKARRVVVAFFLNDMPERQRLEAYMEWLSLSAGKSSFSARLLLDLLRLSFAPSLDGYARGLLGDFDEGHPSFPVRWRMLDNHLETLHGLAAARSVDKPLLVILPVLVDYEVGTWIAIHRRLSGLAADRGFEVIDLLPDLATGRPDALSYRVAPNDLHFNEAANEIVARRLAEHLR